MKCRSRLYSILFIGIVVGFAISTVVQNLLLFGLTDSNHHLQKISDSNSKDRLNIRFAYPQTSEKEREAVGIGVEYKDSTKKMKESSNQKPNIPPQGETITEVTSMTMVSDSQSNPAKSHNDITKEIERKKDKYINSEWHGRSMQDLKRQDPVHKLTDELAQRQPLLIAIVTSVQQLMSQTIALHGTWGKKAKHVLYFTGDVQAMPHLPHGMDTVQLEGIDDKQAGWDVKEFSVIKYLIDHFVEEVDWFLIVGDNVFVNANGLKNKLEVFNASFHVYMGRSLDGEESKKCNPLTGVVYSRGLLHRLGAYLPQCEREGQSISQCLVNRRIYCTQAKETRELFYLDQKKLVETSALFTSRDLTHAVTVYPVRYPKYMYRLYSYFLELNYNTSSDEAKTAISEIHTTHPFVPTHLRSPFKPGEEGTATNKNIDSATQKSQTQQHSSGPSNVVIRPRHVPKNKFEVNFWEYFNQTRLMSVNHEQPSHGIIGGIREEARYALTKAIYIANQGLPPNQRLVFEKLENGYHRVDPMRGSEYILDFVFRKNSDKNNHVKKRVSLLRPYHEVVVPVSSQERNSSVNFIVTLSGLSNRLEQFLANFEKNILTLNKDTSLTITLFDGPDNSMVHALVEKYSSRYPSTQISVINVQGEFARGLGLHHGTVRFKDDQLLFFVDVDLEISTEFLRRCQLNTIQTKQVYFPIFYKLYNLDFVRQYYKGNSSQFLSRHTGHWAHYSYGMVCIYASDYRRSGGYNLNMHGWGEEDIDLLNRVLSHGFEVFRAPDPGLIHLWHRKICDKKTIVTSSAYLHCLQSKAENLADRIELAHYVFENELKQGTIL